MILNDLIDIIDIETKNEKAEAIDKIATTGGEKILKFIFDDMVKFNIAVVRLPSLRFYNPNNNQPPTNQELELLLTRILNKELSGNAALAACTNFGNKLDEDQFKMFCDILESNPRLGISTTDVNKRCEFLKIPQFKVHLCKSLKDVKEKLDYRKHWVVQPKIDGNRIIGIKEFFTKLYSRKGHARESLNHIIEILNKHNGDCVFDGEVEYKDSLEATGAIRRKKEQAKDAIYTLFGIYDINQWKTENHTDPYSVAYQRAKDFIENLSEEDRRFVRLIPSYDLGSFDNLDYLLEAVNGYYEEFLKYGYEGSVMKTLSHTYLPSSGSKRSMETVKNKPWKDSEATVIEINESETNPGTFGSFNCTDNEDRDFDVAPGNISKDELDYIFKHPDKFIGKTLEFKYQGYSIYNKPRHPTAVKFRDDV